MNTENIIKLRENKGLKQKELSEILGINQRTYCTYERGTREPNVDILIKIANYYNVSLDYLTGRYKEQDPPTD